MEAAASKKEFFKNKVAVYFGYNGLKFHGLQKNNDVETIEGVLEKALYDAGMIAPYNFGDLKKQGWQRAARTDKGVHALANVINLKMQFNEDFLLKEPPKDEKEDEEEKKEGALGESEKASPKKKKKDRKDALDMKKIVAVINSHLPKEIRVHSVKNCTKSFNCKAYARSRLYEYVMPCSVYNTKAVGEPLTEEERAAMLTRLTGLAKRFEGTHNYHNYTTKMKANEPQAKRYIMDMNVSVIEIEKTPYYRFLILGQSFIYHQIRKMMGVIVQIIQEGMEDAFLENTFFNNVIKIWLAPPHGLLLNQVNFDFYNKKPDIPEKLLLTADDEKGMDEFRYKIIYPIIHGAELYEKAFTGWVDKMKKSNGMEEESGGENDDEGGEGGAD